MASAKSSRSRPAYTSGVLLSVPAVNGEDGAQLSDKLQIFKSEGFDPDGYVQSKCQTMSEKEIRHLCAYLQDLKKASAEEMRRSVYANYSAFIQTSKEISDLEGELLSIRNLLSTQVAVIHALADGVHIDSLSSSSEDSKNHILTVENQEPSDVEKWAVEFPDILDVLLAERKVDEALAAFEEGEAKVAEAKEKKRLNLDEISSLKASINSRRQELSDQLAEAACQPSTSSVELRASASALKRLGDGSRGLKLILNGHYQKLRYNMQTIHPTTTSYGGAYTAALSQQVFSAIAHAVKDSLDVFGDDATYSSELVIWATKQTEDFANLVKRHALASAAAAGGLRAAVECVEIAIGHCSLLEARGLSLSSVIMKLFRPSIEQALEANLKRIQQSTAALVAADNWSLTYPSGGTCLSNRSGMISQPKLSSSAHRFYSMVQDFLEDVGPLLSMQLSGSALEGLSQVFSSYVKLLIHSLQSSAEDGAMFDGLENKLVSIASTEEQQLALLANASSLSEDLLPRAAMKLTPTSTYQDRMDNPQRRLAERHNLMSPEQKEWKKKLQRTADELKFIFCRQHALDLIYAEDSSCNLTADVYLNMDNTADEPDWCPSLLFQNLFAKLSRMVGMAADMFVGREKFLTLLLMKLAETVMLWLNTDQNFWDDMQDAHNPLGPLGLRQFYLDMQFVSLLLKLNKTRQLNDSRIFHCHFCTLLPFFLFSFSFSFSLLKKMDDGKTILHGKYEIGKILGQGTFGKVYLARDMRTETNVAMKVVGKEMVVKVGMMEQIKREISVMKMVRHPNIVDLHEVMASKTKIYFAMELVRGGELFGKVSRNGRLKEEEVRSYFRQLISAVDFCHSRGVYHRDLKLENLLLDEMGNLKIADFGLTAFADHLRPDGLLHTTCGTPAYVAPEIIQKKGYHGAKVDVWSCGVILYALLAGFLPFQDGNLMNMYRKINRGDFKCPPWFSTETRRLITRLLDPNPKTRITIAKLIETPWFRKSSSRRPQEEPTVEVNDRSRWGKDKPQCLNAFHIISLSEGFDLSPLFEDGRREEEEIRFATREPASGVISRLEGVAAKSAGKFKLMKSENGVRLEGSERGRKGRLIVAAEIFLVAPSVLVVEVKKDGGDALEYRSFCSNELQPALKDIVWVSSEAQVTAV